MRMAAAFAGSLAGMGLLIVLTGVSSSVSYATRRRTREMAIRAAVGATRPTIVWTAIRDSMAVLACGVVVGLPLAVATIRPLADILPDGVDPWNMGMFAAVNAGAAFGWSRRSSQPAMAPLFATLQPGATIMADEANIKQAIRRLSAHDGGRCLL